MPVSTADLDEFSRCWRRQPDGVSCGAAVLDSLVTLLGRRNNKRWDRQQTPVRALSMAPELSTAIIRDMIGTNGATGTTHVEIGNGLDAFDLVHTRYAPEAGVGAERLTRLGDHLRAGDPCLMRLMCGGIRHWMLAVGTDGDQVVLLDPAGGLRQMTFAELAAMMAPRGHEFWAVPGRAMPRLLDCQVTARTNVPSFKVEVVDDHGHSLFERSFIALPPPDRCHDHIAGWKQPVMMAYAPMGRHGLDHDVFGRLAAGAAAEAGIGTIHYLGRPRAARVARRQVIEEDTFDIPDGEEAGDYVIEELIPFTEPVRLEMVNTASVAEYPAPSP